MKSDLLSLRPLHITEPLLTIFFNKSKILNMKNSLIITILFVVFSCSKEKECTNPKFCFSGPAPMPIGFVDRDGNNLLDPSYQDRLDIKAVTSKIFGSIKYEVTSTKGGTIETSFWYLDINKPLRPGCTIVPDCGLCINEECELYISYVNRPEVDTLNILYERVIEYDENNCPCTFYPMRFINHNGMSIMNDVYDKTPYAFIIRK